MQERAPLWILLHIVRYMLGKKNVSRVAAIHHPLGQVNSSAGDVGLLVEIADFIDRTAVNPHAHGQSGIALQCPGNFHCAKDRRFETVAKNERATVASR